LESLIFQNPEPICMQRSQPEFCVWRFVFAKEGFLKAEQLDPMSVMFPSAWRASTTALSSFRDILEQEGAAIGS